MATSSDDSQVKIPDYLVKCCSCHTFFDDVDRHPRLLPCLHCICYRCLRANTKSKRSITCAFCQEKIELSENSFVEYPKDCSKTGYVKLNQIKNSNCSFKCHYCEDDPVAYFYCMTCTRHLCQYCYEHHKRSKRSHDIRPLKEIPDTMETAKMFHVKTTCEVHKGEILDFYCTKCNKCICLKCEVISHKDSEGHKVQEIHSIYKTESEKLLNKKSTVGTLEIKIGKTMDAVENEIADVQKYSESVSAEISTAFEDAYKLLKRRKENLIKEVSSKTLDKTTSLRQQMSKLQKQRQDIKDILAHIQLSSACNDHAALVDVLPMIIQKMSRLGASTTDSEPCVKANLVFMEKKLTTSTPLLGHLTTASAYGPNTQFVLPEVIYAGESVEIEVILSDYNGAAIMDQDIEVTIHVTNVASQNDVLVLTCKLTQKNTWICNGIIPTPGQYDITVYVQGHLVKLEPKRIEVESVPVMASAQCHAFDPDEDVVDVEYYVDNVDTIDEVFVDRKDMHGNRRLCCVAIKLGTTCSEIAIAFCFDIEENINHIRSKTWNNRNSTKAPTCVLLDKNKKFVDFGYDAEDRYSELLMDGEHEDFYFFRGFTTILYEKQSLRRDTTLRDVTGKRMKAIDVFSHCINYLKNGFERELGYNCVKLSPSDLMYVLTIPAVCDDISKQFIREAAEMAGIPHGQLLVVSETLAAFVYCQNVSVDQKQLTFGAEGTRYMIADLGGDTKITVYEQLPEGTVKTVHRSRSATLGSKAVDDAFLEFLDNLFGKELMKKFRKNCERDYQDMLGIFELMKRSASKNIETYYIKIPIGLEQMVENEKDTTMKKVLENSSFSLVGDKLKIGKKIFLSFFEKAVKGISKIIARILSSMKVDTIFMVGGFSNCNLMSAELRNNVIADNQTLIIPENAELAVLKGAVLIGYNNL